MLRMTPIAATLALSTLPLLLGTATSALAETGVEQDSIRLGMVNVQSGPAAALGTGMLAGSKAVFDAVNAAGGVHGRQIELLVADDGYEPDQAIDETLIMIEEEEVFSLYGYVGTPTANAVLPIVQELEVPLVGLFTGAGTLRTPVTEQVFNVRASYDNEAEAMVTHFLANGAKNVAVFYQDDGFGRAVLSGAEKALARRDMTGARHRHVPAQHPGGQVRPGRHARGEARCHRDGRHLRTAGRVRRAGAGAPGWTRCCPPSRSWAPRTWWARWAMPARA